MPTEIVTKHGIEAVVAKALMKALTKSCITEVPAEDMSRANHVIIGKPTNERADEIVIAIMMEHPFGPKFDRAPLLTMSQADPQTRPMRFPGETLGGMDVSMEIGTVWISIREKMPYEEAIEVISSVRERVKATINRDSSLVPLQDDYGNFLYRLETFQAEGYETGGRQVSINHRWVDFRFFVAVTNCRDDDI